jgi:hypothetical protein
MKEEEFPKVEEQLKKELSEENLDLSELENVAGGSAKAIGNGCGYILGMCGSSSDKSEEATDQ